MSVMYAGTHSSAASPESGVEAIDAACALAVALQALLEHEGRALSLKDVSSGSYVHVNGPMALLAGRAPADVIGHSDAELFDAPLAQALRLADQGALLEPGVTRSEHRLEREGQRHDVELLRVALAPDANGRRLLCTIWTDLSAQRRRDADRQAALQQLEELQRANESLRRDSEDRGMREASVGLYRREQFDDHLRREIDLSLREHREFAVVYVDVDPAVEDTPPHDAAGRASVLDALGRLLRSNTRAMDAPCRLENERFAILLSGVGLATAHARMEGLRRQCATQLVASAGEALRFTVSMGVASFPHTSQTQAGLLEAAAAALLQAHERGGNHVALASISFSSGN
jgi:diguanylate cyclase (GGDEF)-like protein